MAGFKIYYDRYVRWILENPQRSQDFETVLKYLSYCISERGVYNSSVLSEMLYSASNLLNLFNDHLIAKRYDVFYSEKVSHHLKLWLSTIEYAEVFFEIAAVKFWGEVWKWIFITTIQLLKTIIRAILLLRHNQTLIGTPSVAPLKRAEVIDSENTLIDYTNGSYRLKSGRLIRSVNSDVSLTNRNWVPPKDLNINPPEYTSKLMVASEVIYISKPIFHLLSMHCFGKYSWHPWFTSIILDLAR